MTKIYKNQSTKEKRNKNEVSIAVKKDVRKIYKEKKEESTKFTQVQLQKYIKNNLNFIIPSSTSKFV